MRKDKKSKKEKSEGYSKSRSEMLSEASMPGDEDDELLGLVNEDEDMDLEDYDEEDMEDEDMEEGDEMDSPLADLSDSDLEEEMKKRGLL